MALGRLVYLMGKLAEVVTKPRGEKEGVGASSSPEVGRGAAGVTPEPDTVVLTFPESARS